MGLPWIEEMKEELFRRLTGVRKNTFSEMLAVRLDAEARRKARGGRRNRLPVETRLLMMLEYWRE